MTHVGQPATAGSKAGATRHTGTLSFRHKAGTSTAVSAIALAAALGVAPAPAYAACDTTTPASGATVTCDAVTTETDAITAPGATDVTVNFDPNATLQTDTSPAIDLGGGALIDMSDGARISDFDPATLPAPILDTIEGDFAGITDQATLGALYDSLQAESPVRPAPGAATIELGAGDPEALQTSIHEITAKVTVNKAKMADLTMNAINAYIDGTGPDPRTPSGPATPTPPASATGRNTVFIDGGTVLSAGAAGVRAPDALAVIITGDGAISTLTENAPAILVEGPGALDVVLADGSVSTFFDGSAGLALPSDNSAMSVIISGDSRITTAGDNAPAILGPGANSVFNLEIDRTATDAVPTIATFGDASPGVLVHGTGGSTATLQFVGDGPGPNPAFQTSGIDSSLIDIDLGVNSSLNLTAEALSFGTFGDGSGVFDLSAGDNSDLLVFLLDTSLTSEGDNATLLETSRGESAISNLAVIDSTLTTEGDGAAGIVSRVTNGGDTSSDTYFLANVTIDTGGDDAPAFLVEEGGEASTRTLTIDDSSFTTDGTDSPAVSLSGLGDGSAVETTITNTTISTTGTNAGGLFVGGAGESSAWSTTLSDLTVTTTGDGSGAITLLGVANDSSVASFDAANLTLSTEGNNSVGLLAVPLRGPGSLSTTVVDLLDISVTTQGTGSSGIIIGDAALYDGAAPNIDQTSLAYAVSDLTIETEGDAADGLVLYGLGAGATDSDATFAVTDVTVTTTGDRARGIVLDIGSTGATGSVFTTAAENLSITTSGTEAHGLVIGEGLGADMSEMGTDSVLAVSDITSTTTGAGAAALLLKGGTMVAPENSAFSASGIGAHAVLGQLEAGQTAEITALASTSYEATGPGGSGMAFEGSGPDASGIVTVAEGAMVSGAENALMFDGAMASVLVAGTITGDSGVAVQFDDLDDRFELHATHVVNGTVEADAGTDTFVLGGTGAQTFDQELLGTRYNDFEIFEKEDASTWTLANLSSIPLWEVKEGTLVLQNEFIDPIARGFTVRSGATLTLANTAPAGADTGADNRFEIHPGAIVNGNVFAGTGTDTFVLGGPGTDTFDVALIGTKYNGFDSFLKEGASTWTLTGTNTLAAPFLVSGGTLVNDATLANMMMTVGPDGRLEGIGTLGGLTVDGTVAPGNSIGTITVAGDVTFNTGSVYEVELAAPDQADLIAATGTATINGGEVQVTKLSTEESYRGGQSYRIITADSVVRNGDFTYDNPFLFLDSDIEYGDTYVDILLTAEGIGMDFTSVARTFNQVQSATGLSDLEQSGDALTVYNELLFLTDEVEARRAFDLASGEVHASSQHVIDQAFSLFSRTMGRQAAAGLTGVGPGGQGAVTRLSFAAVDDTSFPARSPNLWIAPLGGRGSVDANNNAAKLDWWTAGIAGGYEGPVDTANGHAWLGFGLGYLYSESNVDARLSSADADSYNIGVYGGWSDGPLSLTGSLGYMASRVETRRQIVFGGLNRTAAADYWTHTLGLSAEAAYAFSVGPRAPPSRPSPRSTPAGPARTASPKPARARST